MLTDATTVASVVPAGAVAGTLYADGAEADPGSDLCCVESRRLRKRAYVIYPPNRSNIFTERHFSLRHSARKPVVIAVVPVRAGWTASCLNWALGGF